MRFTIVRLTIFQSNHNNTQQNIYQHNWTRKYIFLSRLANKSSIYRPKDHISKTRSASLTLGLVVVIHNLQYKTHLMWCTGQPLIEDLKTVLTSSKWNVYSSVVQKRDIPATTIQHSIKENLSWQVLKKKRMKGNERGPFPLHHH